VERANSLSADTASKFCSATLVSNILHLIIFNRDEHEKRPETFQAGIRWSYEPSTGTSGLRKHIKNVHLELYKKLCLDHNIQPSEMIVEKAASEEAPILPAAREPFSKETLLRYIRNFIVADDQVSFKSNSASFNLTDHFSPSMSSSAQSLENYWFICERIFPIVIFMDATNLTDRSWRIGTVTISH
jgi:hypothetical protein